MLITREDIKNLKVKQTVKVIANGAPGTGKTHFALTCPKVAYMGTEPNGLDTIKCNPVLLENLVYAEEFIPSHTEDIKSVFDRMDAFVKKANDDFTVGKVETLALDNATFLAENRWMFINKYEKNISRSGIIDTRAMYGTLGRWLYPWVLTQIVSFPGNVILTCQEMDEEEEDADGKTIRTGKIISNILGGFREKVSGFFSGYLFLEKQLVGQGQYRYRAICQQTGQRGAKNRYGLPPIVENISYKAIIDAIAKANLEKAVVK